MKNKLILALTIGLLTASAADAQQNTYQFDITTKTGMLIPANSKGMADSSEEDAPEAERVISLGKVNNAFVRLINEEASPLASCQDYLLEGLGAGVSGEYHVTSGSGRVYCDMVRDDGGWMLYLDFGSSTARSALVANGIDTLGEVDAYAQRHFASFNNQGSTHAKNGVHFYTSSTPEGYMGIVAPSGYTQMKVDYGNGYRTTYHTSFVVVNLNGVNQSRTNTPPTSGAINKNTATFPISGGERVTISEANSINYLDAVWVR